MRLILFISLSVYAAGRPDTVIADFEGKTWAGWQAQGDAFGDAPYRPTGFDGVLLYQGSGIAFSGRASFALKGTLTSPPFLVERDCISFLAAGEREPAADLGVELLLDGKVVRNASATHPQAILEVPNHNYRDPRMFWRSWDVRDLAGKTVQIRVNDQSLYGAIAVDHFVQTDEPKSLAANATELFHETYRPQFHYTSRAYMMSDPNGLLYYRGAWHLFHQYRYPGPAGNAWGHAVSPDLVHWQHLAAAIPSSADKMNYSGSGLVDAANASGLKRGDDAPLLLFYTNQPAGPMSMREGPFPKNTQMMVYSTDGGRTFTAYPGNPVLTTPAYRDRDPKVFFHNPTHSWILVLSLSANNVDRGAGEYGIFRSTNLKEWELTQRLGPGAWYWECPDLFELPLDGDATRPKWVLVKGNGEYMVGAFDGRRFTPETDRIQNRWGGQYYATQTFNDAPGGRRVQMAWMNTGRPTIPGDYPGMPFNQQMCFPRELTLRSTASGPRLFRYPVKEIERLYASTSSVRPLVLKPGDNPLAGMSDDLLDIEADIELTGGAQLTFNLRGEKVVYDSSAQKLKAFGATVPMPSKNGRLRLRILLDRTSIEVFANGGEADVSGVFFPAETNRSLSLNAAGSAAQLRNLTVHRLRSIYDQAK